MRQRGSKAWRHITSSAPSPLWPAVLCAAVKKLPSDSTIFKIVHSTQFCVTHNKHCLLWWTLNTVNKPTQNGQGRLYKKEEECGKVIVCSCRLFSADISLCPSHRHHRWPPDGWSAKKNKRKTRHTRCTHLNKQ